MTAPEWQKCPHDYQRIAAQGDTVKLKNLGLGGPSIDRMEVWKCKHCGKLELFLKNK
jgi:hypothetical protein